MTDTSITSQTRASRALTNEARQLLGVTGHDGVDSMRGAFGGYAIVALGLLTMSSRFQDAVLFILGPDIAATLGVSKGVVAVIVLLKAIVLGAAGVGVAALARRHRSRAGLSVASAFVWGGLTIAAAFATNVWGLGALLVASSLAMGTVNSLHEPLLFDSYAPHGRVRADSFYRTAAAVGQVAAPLIILVGASVFHLTWRGVLLVLGGVSLAGAIGAARLRDPGIGVRDADRVRALVEAGPRADLDANLGGGFGFFESLRRVLRVRTVRAVLSANLIVGVLLAPLTTYLSFFLQERWDMRSGGRSVFAAAMFAFGVVALLAFAKRGEGLFQRDPAALLRFAGLSLTIAGVAIGLAIASPWFAPMVLLLGCAFGMITIVTPAMYVPMLTVVPAAMRPHAVALVSLVLVAGGGISGIFWLGALDSRFGTTVAILSLVPSVVGAGISLRKAATSVSDDLDRTIAELLEAAELDVARSRGVHQSLLVCRKVNFSYDPVQVLFDVDFTVDDGEMVALLGTNGAGKSTLLNVIAGIDFVTSGSVRYRGTDITYLDPTRRVRLGVREVAGGRGTFGPMTVVENLRVLGYVHGRNRRAVEAGIDASFDAFPTLADRRDQPAATLSGGQRQMLTLAAAYVARPELLLIDELSLGLAPIVVTSLLNMVRQINATGTAVVLVEQSVTTALSLVEHAYFMERGAVRFDGAAAELLHRVDLLRSVFLEGAGSIGTKASDNGSRS